MHLLALEFDLWKLFLNLQTNSEFKLDVTAAVKDVSAGLTAAVFTWETSLFLTKRGEDKERRTKRGGQKEMDRERWTERDGQREMDRERWTEEESRRLKF